MRKLLIATHGKLASGFKSSLELFVSEDGTIHTIDAYGDEDNKDYTADMQSFIDSIGPEDEGIIFTDIAGGSVNQKAFQLCYGLEKNIFIITGANLPAILGVYLHPNPITNEEIKGILQECQATLVVTEKAVVESNDDSDDFL